MNFDIAFDRLMIHEGGYSDNPADNGGKTRYGVTERVARGHGYVGDMRQLPLSFAKTIYRKSYWDSIRADELPDALRFDTFDAAVNSGVKQAARWLQRAAGVADDGIIGPMTLAAARKDPDRIARRMAGHRLAMMVELADWHTFGRGWARRIAANLKEA